MTDEQFIKRLQELDAQGKDGIPAMRDVLRGQMSRLIALGARGIGAREVRAQVAMVKTQIVNGFPDSAAKEGAISYWNTKRRPDLVARLEEISEQFFNHHYSRNSRFTAWNLVWATWYKRAVSVEKPPREFGLFSAPVVFEQTDLKGWIRRLEIFYLGDDDLPVHSWSPKWGPAPDRPGCLAPAEALARFSNRRKA